MKKHFTVFIACLTSTLLFGQAQKYYWVENTRHYFEIDSTQFLIELSSIDNAKASRLKNDPDVKALRIKNKSTYQFVIKANARENFIKRNSLAATQIAYPALHEAGTNGTAFITDEITVKFEAEPDLKSLSLKYGIVVIKKTSYGAYLFKVANSKRTLQIANQIKEKERVVWSNPNFVHILHLNQVNDPLYPNQYYLNNTGQAGGTTNIDINAPEAWGITLGCNNIRVAVIDDGVENHEDFNGRVLPGFTAGVNNTGGVPLNHASKGHGVSCAGIIAASHNNLGIRGVAPNAQIVPVNIFPYIPIISPDPNVHNPSGVATNEEIATAINWAWRPDGGNADILSNSWGGGVANADVTTQIFDARTFGRGNLGAIVVFSSGNSHQLFSGVNFPGNVNGVITVGAIDRNGNIWNYSSRGVEMDLVAPSGGIINSNGDVATTDRMGVNGYTTGHYFNNFGGTSAACPQVAGVAALMLSVNPNLSEAQVRTILQQTATDMGPNGFDNTFGFGRLNAQAAIQEAMPTLTGPSYVCNGGATFALGNVPIGAQVTWQATPAYLFQTSSGSFTSMSSSHTISLNPVMSASGSGTLTVTVNSCGNPVQIQRTFWAGVQSASFSGSYNSSQGTFTFSAPYVSGVTVQWVVDGITSPCTGFNCVVSAPNCNSGPPYMTYKIFEVSLTTTNQCGSKTACKKYKFTCTPSRSLTYEGGCGSTGGDPPPCVSAYQVSPNPAKAVINIVALKPPPCESSIGPVAGSIEKSEEDDLIIQSVSLIDRYGQEEYSRQFYDKPKSTELDVSKFKKGIYILKISDGKHIENHRIIIE